MKQERRQNVCAGEGCADRLTWHDSREVKSRPNIELDGKHYCYECGMKRIMEDRKRRLINLALEL